MKKNLKIILQFIFAAALLMMMTVVIFAVSDAPIFEVIAADGTVTEYYDEADFSVVFGGMQDGETLKLCKNIEMTDGAGVSSTAASPKTVSLDLAGHGIYALSKITMFNIGTYTTLNVYSSAADAYLYVVGENATSGGNIFAIRGSGSRVNFGEMTVGDVTYPGSNITTFSSCFVDVRIEGAEGFFGNGGTHYSNISDWKSFIGARTGDGVAELKNSNIILLASNALLYNESINNAFVFENCVILNMNSTQRPILGEVHCPVTIKDCVTNYYLDTSSELTGKNLVTLLGENIFGAEKPYNPDMLADGSAEYVTARTSRGIELVEGGYDGWYYGNTGKFNKIKLEMPEADALGILTQADKTTEYTWTYGKESVTEIWYSENEPIFPYTLPAAKEPGMYRYGWLKSVSDDGKVTYTGGRIADFDISVSVVYDGGELCYNIYVPAYVIDMGYLIFPEASVGGAVYSSKEWEFVSVGGEEYYTISSMTVPEDDIDSRIDVFLPCDFPYQKGQSIYVETVWSITLSEYIERVMENEAQYDSASVELVKEIAQKYFETEIVN